METKTKLWGDIKLENKSKILLVDDNEMNLAILEKILKNKFHTERATSGKEALELAPLMKPDIILLDIMMPGINGYDVCTQIKSNPELKKIKVIMVSAKAMISERLKGYEVGADDYIVKPFEEEELLAKVRVYVRLKSTEEFNSQLQKEVREQTKEIREAKEAAETANQAKSEFVSTMTHELRNPLTSIIGFADILSFKCDGELNEKQLNSVKVIRESADHLSKLVSDVFDVVKVDRNAVELSLVSFPADDFIHSTADMMTTQFKAKNLNVSINSDSQLTKITGDHRRCKQILLNLLSNSIKYTENGGNIEIRAEKNSDSIVKISVIDDGVGIEPGNQEKLFTEFYQVNRARDQKLGGTGIGLALTHRLVELHRGEIGVESELGKGSTFWFTLPITDVTLELDGPKEEEFTTLPKSVAGRRVLVSEDIESNQAIIIEMLDRSDIEVQIAKNGQETLELAKYRKPDLILMDLRMPVMDGFQATEKLRSMPEFKDTPIIALSASADKISVDRSLAAGCNEHLSKPFEINDLNKILEKYLSSLPAG